MLRNFADKNFERLYGLDIIRFLAFLAIVIFHSSWVLWSPAPPDPLPTFLWRGAEFYARSLSFSGFTILFLSCFLMGLKSDSYRKNRWLPFFLILGFFTFSFCTYLKEGEFSFEWDIYPLLTVGIFTGKFLLHANKYIKIAFALLSLILLSFPVWELTMLRSILPRLEEILIGQCPQDYADWPILPWIALLWLGLLSGSMISSFQKKGYKFHIRRFEVPIFAFISLFFFKYRTQYFHTQLGDGWACYTFRQEPKIFWSHFLFWVSLIRLSLHPKIQDHLSQYPFILFMSNLKINQHFYLAYFFHYIVIFALAGLFQANTHKGWAVDGVLILTLPMTEWILRFINKLRYLKPR